MNFHPWAYFWSVDLDIFSAFHSLQLLNSSEQAFLNVRKVIKIGSAKLNKKKSLNLLNWKFLSDQIYQVILDPCWPNMKWKFLRDQISKLDLDRVLTSPYCWSMNVLLNCRFLNISTFKYFRTSSFILFFRKILEIFGWIFKTEPQKFEKVIK